MPEPLDAAVIREPRRDLDRLAMVVERPGRVLKRWADDEPDVENIPIDLQVSSSIPGGDADLNCALLRDFAYRHPDLRNLNRVRVLGPGADKAWGGFLTKTPQTATQVSPAAVGDVGRLKGDPSLRMIPVDRDPSHWTGPPNARRIFLINSSLPHKQDPEVVAANSGQALKLEITDGWQAPFQPRCEAWYDAGQGLVVKRVYCNFAGDPNTAFILEALARFDEDGEPFESTGDVYGAASGLLDFSPAADYQWMSLSWRYNATPAGVEGGVYRCDLTNLAVYGGDVAPVANPNGGPPGVLGQDVLEAILQKAGNGIELDPASSTDDFVIPHLAWLDAVTAEQAILDTNRYFRNLWGVYDGKLRWAPPESFGRLWHIRRDEGADPQFNGPDSDQEYNGVMVRYDDALTGTRRIVGPPQSGYVGTSGLSTEGLADQDPFLAVNEWNERRWAVLDAGLTSEAGAIRLGELFLAGLRARVTSGSIEIASWQVFDATGARYPAWAPSAGDRLVVDDEANSAERLIVEASYSHSSKRSSLTLDSPPDALEAMQERLQVVLVGVVD